MYNEDDYLLLSGLQHFLFCRRQWALIHIEQLWAENYRTTDGKLVHRNAHNTGNRTRRGNVLAICGMRIHSARLGIAGECDVVEFRKDPDGVELRGEIGLWKPYPVEYKRGRQKPGPEDEAQLCAQAMCLEEMLCCEIQEGALYYGEERHRTTVVFSAELRQLVESSLKEMHELYNRGYTPKVKPSKGCNACSLKDFCLPKLMKSVGVSEYLRDSLGERE